MFIVLYRWRIKPEMEERFISAWTEITRFMLDNRGSLGSRLHRAGDGTFYAYAQWKRAEDRDSAFSGDLDEISDAAAGMNDAVEERFPEIILEEIADLLA